MAMAVIFPEVVPKMHYAPESYLVVIPLLDKPECVVHVNIGWMLPVLLAANEQYFLALFVKAGCSDMFHSGHKINLFLATNAVKIALRSGGKFGRLSHRCCGLAKRQCGVFSHFAARVGRLWVSWAGVVRDGQTLFRGLSGEAWPLRGRGRGQNQKKKKLTTLRG